MTTFDIIKGLSIDESTKKKILDGFDRFTRDQQIAIEHLAWSTYFALYNQRLDENLAKEYENVKRGKGKLGDELYGKALSKTDQEMEKSFTESISKRNLSEARRAMEIIVREIQAAKKANKAKN